MPHYNAPLHWESHRHVKMCCNSQFCTFWIQHYFESAVAHTIQWHWNLCIFLLVSQKKFRKYFFCLLQTYTYANTFGFHHSIVDSTVYIPEGDKALNKACRVMLDNASKWPPWQIGWPGPGSPRMQSDAQVLASDQKSFDIQLIYSRKYN